MKKRILLLVIMAMVIIGGCGVKKEAENTTIIKTVLVTEVKGAKSNINSNFTGEVSSSTQTKISFKVGGTIKKIYVQLGEKVKKGEIIAELEDKDYILQLQTAKAGLKTAILAVQEAKTRVEQADAAYKQANSQVSQAMTSIENAKVQYETTSKKYERISKMYEDGSASLSDYESIKLAKDSSKLAYDSAKTGLEQAKTGLKNAEVIIEQAKIGLSITEAQVNSVEKSVEQAKNALSYSKIYSPVDGYVVLKMMEENENIGANNPLLILNTGDNNEVKIYVPEVIISKLKIGQTAEILVDAFSNKKFLGKIKELGNASTGFGTTYPVTISINEKNNKIKSGMTASVNIKIDNKMNDNSIIVPLKTVQMDSQGNYVFLVKKISGKYVLNKKYVTTGDVSDDGIKINKGLEKEDIILAAGIRFAIEGEQVNIVEDKEE